MQGVILIGIQRFVRERLGSDFWRTVESEANIVGRLYLPSHAYPMSELDAVVASVSRHSGMSVSLVLETVGDYLAPDMLGAYANMLDPNWGLLEILLRSEAIIERAALKHGERLEPPPLTGRAGVNGEVVVTYQGIWRICPLIKGLIRGFGAHMDQPVLIDESRCMLMGSSSCEMGVRLERARPMRQRMSSVPSGMSAFRPSVDRASSLPPAPSSRNENKAFPGPTRQTMPPPAPAARTSQLPPSPLDFELDPMKRK